MNKDIWNGCYTSGWQGNIVPEAFCHPAKFSCALIGKIYDHVLKMGWVKAGDTVIDPFGGVALGALHSLINGLNWIGIELEPKFVKLGQQNIDLWNRKFRDWPNLGTARIIQGDSRNLKGALSKLLEINRNDSFKAENMGKRRSEAGLIVSSPPYAQTPVEQTHMTSNDRGNPDNPNYRPSWKKKLDEGYANIKRPYGQSPGQLGSMKEGQFDAVVSSPPYENAISSSGHGLDLSKSNCKHDRLKHKNISLDGLSGSYSDDLNNLGNTSGDTFWQASKEIVQGCYDLLKPGGHAIWVTKNYINNKQIVPFSDRWATLCESVGFKIVCWHQASLIQDHGTKGNLFGEDEKIITERKSFFRRLAEKKGSPRIDFEDVICMVK
jgi:DNA modification methylase